MTLKLARRCLLCGLICWQCGCQRTPASLTKTEPPSKVTGAVKETQLTTIELTPEAESRLGIETATIEMRTLPRQRSYGGEVVLPLGATVIVSAPMTGRLQSPSATPLPRPGAVVVEKQALMLLFPLLSPAEKISLSTQAADAEGLVQQAEASVEARRIDLKRAELQNEKGVGLGSTLDNAKAQVIQSQKVLDAAMSRKRVLDACLEGDSSHTQKPFVIEAPQSGLIRALHAVPGEFVTAGAILLEVMNVDTVWIRVPVYVGETTEIDLTQHAEIGQLDNRVGNVRLKANPVAAPPTATALASTVDLYYELPNPQGTLRPGQRVSVDLTLVGDSQQRVIKWSAVVHDIHGGDWIYERTSEHKYVRRRVQVRQVIDSWAVLDRGPDVGTTIVVTGVAEIFGTEFWVQK